jgi:hypothetical protein
LSFQQDYYDLFIPIQVRGDSFAPELALPILDWTFSSPFGFEDTLLLPLANIGCDTLKQLAITPLNAPFVYLNNRGVWPDTIDILPNDTFWIPIRALGRQPGVYRDSMFLQSAIGNDTVFFEKTVFPASDLSVRTSFRPSGPVAAYNRNTAAVPFSFTVKNNGNATIHYETFARRDDTLKFMHSYFGSSTGQEAYSGMISFGEGLPFVYPQVKRHPIDPKPAIGNYWYLDSLMWDSLIMVRELYNHHVVYIPEAKDQDTTHHKRFWTTGLVPYVRNGGTVVVMGSGFMNGQLLLQSGLLHGSYEGSVYRPSLNIVDSTGNNALFGTTGFQASDSIYRYSFTDTNLHRIVVHQDMNGQTYDVMVRKDLGLGRIIYIGMDYLNPSDIERQISNNQLWLINDQVRSPNAAMFTFSSQVDSLQAGDSATYTGFVHPEVLRGGDHNFFVGARALPPYRREHAAELSMLLNVRFDIRTDSCHTIGTVARGQVKSKAITLFNHSTSDTVIVNIDTARQGIFRIQPSAFEIPNGDSIQVTVSMDNRRQPTSFGVRSHRYIMRTPHAPNWIPPICVEGVALSFRVSQRPQTAAVAMNFIRINNAIALREADSLELINHFAIAPSPNDGRFELHWLAMETPAAVTVWNSQGKVVFEKKHIDGQQGTYFVELPENTAEEQYLLQLRIGNYLFNVSFG